MVGLCVVLAVVGGGAGTAGAQGGLTMVVVDLSEQHAYLYRAGGELAARVPVSTGRNGRTPVGTFRVYAKNPMGTASSDHRVRMPWFTKFRGGVGFHGLPRKGGRSIPTPLGVRPVSHGCVRMADTVAHWVYNELPVGAPVVVRR